jgi:arsenate reductase
MAEGFARALKGDFFNVYSAGTKKHGMNPYAVKVMGEVGIDLSQQQSKTTEELPEISMDYVVTVCSDAHENCPFFPGGKVIHFGFDDPPRLTREMEKEEDILPVYRRVRDEIKAFVQEMEKHLG